MKTEEDFKDISDYSSYLYTQRKISNISTQTHSEIIHELIRIKEKRKEHKKKYREKKEKYMIQKRIEVKRKFYNQSMRHERYNLLLNLVCEHKPKTIVEIGTWTGKTAISMITRALKYNDVHYIGYDLFEEASDNTDYEEFNVKKHEFFKTVVEKFDRLKSYESGFTYELYKGNTRKILKEHNVDFVFIDGGHSVETIRNDYEKVKGSKVIVFDDYYLPDEEGNIVDISKYGANKIVDKLNRVEIVEQDNITVRDIGVRVAMAIVRPDGWRDES